MKRCLSPDLAQAFVSATVTQAEREEVLAHLGVCSTCRRWISALVDEANEASVAHFTDPGGGVVVPEELHAGDHVGRYRIEGFVGQGGMGSVFIATDPRLDRRVAIKLIHCESDASVERLQAEARSLARIRDPHIVEVYDVGDGAAGPYVVMELIAGASLRTWLDEERSLDAVLDVFLAAGAGLSAAHRRGILHRDFKSSNVIVGDDGRARVIDFGLAIAERADETAEIAGTPGYLAPELFDGIAPSAASDQFSFCVALRRALSAPTCRGIPSPSLRRALARGLHPDPTQRWRSMDALLAALDGGRRRKRRPGLWALGAVGLVLAVAVGWPSEGPCSDAAARLRPAWTSQDREAFETHVRSGAQPWSVRASDRAASRLDAFVSDWDLAFDQACHTRNHDRLACLEAQAARFHGSLELVEQLEPFDPTQLDTLLALPSPSACADPVGLERATDLETLVELELEMARLEGLASAGQLGASMRVAEILEPRIEASMSPRLAARLALVEGSVLAARRDPDALERLERAASLASASRDDRLQARAAVVHAESLALYELGHGGVVDRAVAHARGLLDRVGAGPPMRARLVRVEAAELANAGDHALALERFQRAMELTEEAYGADAPQVSAVAIDVAATSMELGRLDRAEQMCRDALARLQETLGPDHASTGGAFECLGNVLLASGRPQEATQAFAQVLRIREAVDGPESLTASVSLGNLGGARVAAGRIDEAIPSLERAVELEQRFDPNGPRLMSLFNHLGNAYRLSNRPEDAEQAYLRGVVIGEAVVGPDHPGLGVLLGGLAAVQLETGPESALETATRSLELRRSALGPEHPSLAFNLLMVGHARAGLGQTDAAVATLREAEALVLEHPAAARLLPDIRFALAQMLWDAGRPGARALAESAAVAWEEAGDEVGQADVRAWLAETARKK